MNTSICNLVSPPILLGLGLLFWLPSFDSLAAQESSQQTDSPSRWVSELADSDPQVRRLAEFALLAAAEDVVPALEVGVKSYDLEVSSRSNILLEKIKLRRKRRISKLFLVEDQPADPSLNLAAWPEFRRFVGSDEIAVRRMFLRMCDELPSVFENYGIRGQQSAAALAKIAAAVLTKGNGSKGDALAAEIAFLFLTDLANEKRDGSTSGELFDEAEMGEFVAFFTSDSSGRWRRIDFEPAFSRLIADWMLQQKAAGFVSDSELFRFVHQSGNKALLQRLKDQYDSLDVSLKLKFIDLVTAVVAREKKKDWRGVHAWLKDALVDDAIAIRTRRKKNPSKELTVTVQMLAQGTLAKAIEQSLTTGEPVKSEAVFGSFEFSGTPFLIVAQEQEKKRLNEYLESNLKRE